MSKNKESLEYIGKNIQRIRFLKGFTNREFAKYLGVSEQLTSYYQTHGVSDVRILQRIAKIFDVEIEELTQKMTFEK